MKRLIGTTLLSALLLFTAWYCKPALASPAAHTVYLPLMPYQDDTVTAIPGHGEQIIIERDWAIVQCQTNQIEVEQVGAKVIVKCRR